MNYLEIILDNIEDILVIINPHGEILLYNAEASRLQKDIGVGSLDIGKNFLNVLPESSRRDVQSILDAVLEERKSFRSYVEYPVRKDSKLCLELNYIPVVDDGGEVRYVNIIGSNVTDHKIFQRKISALANEITSVIDNANAVIFGTDSRGYITDWNKHCAMITGYSKNEAYTKKVEELLIPPAERGRFRGIIEQALNKQLITNYEVPIYTREGKEVVFLLNATPRITTSGETNGVTFVGQNITELIEYRSHLERKVEERTKELQQAIQKEQEVVEMRSRFISIASHEFRTPLLTIQFSIDSIKKDKERMSQDMLLQKLGAIERQVKHMTHLLEDVLDENKANAKIRIVVSSIPLPDFFNSLIEEIREATSHTHTIETSFTDLPSHFASDEKLLRHIAGNLLTNAIKFSPGKTSVFLDLTGTPTHLVMTVRDEGMGITEVDRTKIFQPFLRGSAVSHIPGTGLGLSIVKRSVELLSGEITFESKPGSGTTFTVTLPWR